MIKFRQNLFKLITSTSIWHKDKLPRQWKESIILPVHKKGDKTDCSNYWVISLLSNSHKIFTNILLSNLCPYRDEFIGDHQFRFRRNRSTTDQIFCIVQIFDKKCKYNETAHQLSIEFKNACDSVMKEVYNILIEFRYA